MAFKMKGFPMISGTKPMKMAVESAKKMKAAMKLKEEAAMKEKAMPDFPDVDGDGNKTEPIKEATASVKSAVGMKGMYVNFSLNDSNGNQIYSKTGYSLLFGGAVKKIFKNLIANGGEAYNFDKSLGVQKTYIKTDNKKSEAIEELKKMKELLDLGLINKNEFDIKSKELKKIILGN